MAADGSWPLSFQKASDLAWAGVVFLGADAVVEVVLRRKRRGSSRTETTETVGTAGNTGSEE